jgi:lipopolysaccharide export system permease protein
MNLLSRYLLRQLAAPFVFALTALTSLMLLSQIAKKFGSLVGKGLPWTVIAEVFALSVPFIVAMTLPMAVLLAVLYAFSHLAADNEVTAMRASGISVYQVLRPEQRPAPEPTDRHRPEETDLRASGTGHQ